mmetsp:Transcript_22668/g.57958  ORF Transcript_22668/g.57958 Transcript_22668/m.57958 type:complete len:255 (-) Transcript_22668:1366-2130(-)
MLRASPSRQQAPQCSPPHFFLDLLRLRLPVANIACGGWCSSCWLGPLGQGNRDSHRGGRDVAAPHGLGKELLHLLLHGIQLSHRWRNCTRVLGNDLRGGVFLFLAIGHRFGILFFPLDASSAGGLSGTSRIAFFALVHWQRALKDSIYLKVVRIHDEQILPNPLLHPLNEIWLIEPDRISTLLYQPFVLIFALEVTICSIRKRQLGAAVLWSLRLVLEVPNLFPLSGNHGNTQTEALCTTTTPDSMHVILNVVR